MVRRTAFSRSLTLETEVQTIHNKFYNYRHLARLPELPTEFYDIHILTSIGNLLGTLLKIDTSTSDIKRNRYACLCIQVHIDLPLKTTVYIGTHKQIVIYEGINLICFKCGRIGHKNLNCPYSSTPSPQPPSTSVAIESTQTHLLETSGTKSSNSASSLSLPKPGAWMLVQSKKFKIKNNSPKNQNASSNHHPRENPIPSVLSPKKFWQKKKALTPSPISNSNSCTIIEYPPVSSRSTKLSNGKFGVSPSQSPPAATVVKTLTPLDTLSPDIIACSSLAFNAPFSLPHPPSSLIATSVALKS